MDSLEPETVPAAEVEKRFGHYRDEADKRPVLISEDGRPRTVLLSYEAFVRLRGRERRAYGLDDLPQHLVTAILETEVPVEWDEVPNAARP